MSEAAEADVLLLVVDLMASSRDADVAFLKDWNKWYADHPGLQVPPTLGLATHIDSPLLAADWKPPYDWSHGQGPREAAVKLKLDVLKDILSASITEIVAVAPGATPPFGITETLLPTLTRLCHKAERNALIRHLWNAKARSRAGRLVRQVGEQGKSLWKSLRDRGKTGDGTAA